MNETQRQFINQWQGNFPLTEQPFTTVAAELGITDEELISLIRELLEQGFLSRFGPLYDASSMGGSITLAALSVPEDNYEAVAKMVNAMPEVAHNYQREHRLNMWFVIATETADLLHATIDRIEQEVNLPVYNFPKLQTFYLGLWLRLDEDDKVSTVPVPGPLKQGGMIIDDLDRKIVQTTQAGLPLVAAPFDALAEQLGLAVEEVLARVAAMQANGIIRRIAAVPNHYALGYTVNGMSVWNVTDERISELGKQVGALDFVSHCYHRPRHLPLWPYNLFAMVHGRNSQDVEANVADIASLLGEHCRGHEVLYSKRILKKTGLRIKG